MGQHHQQIEDRECLLEDSEVETGVKLTTTTRWYLEGGGMRERDALERRAIALCMLCVAADVTKLSATYATQYYNHGRYPIKQEAIVALVEFFKFLVCALARGFPFCIIPSIRFIIPSLIYVATNNIFYFALNFTTPAIWLVLVQIRILFTILTYKLVFGQNITFAQWTAGFLVIGAIVGSQLSQLRHDIFTGLGIVLGLGLLNSSLSTVAAVYTEFLFKSSTEETLWDQQAQLYLGSAIIAFGSIFFMHSDPSQLVDNSAEFGVFALVGIAIVFGVVHGICVANVVKKLDNIVKYQLSGIVHILNGVANAWLFPDKFQVTVSYAISLIVLLYAVYLYECREFRIPEWILRRTRTSCSMSPKPSPKPNGLIDKNCR